MGRLIAIALLALTVAGCQPEPNHDLTPLEQAVTGYWQHTYTRFQRTSGEDLEHLELRPDRTGYWFVSRDSAALAGNTMLIRNWEITNDSLKLDMLVPSMEVPSPQGGVQQTDSLVFSLYMVPLHLTQDSVVLKEVCSLSKRVCDGVRTWYNYATLDQLMATDPDSLSMFNVPETVKMNFGK